MEVAVQLQISATLLQGNKFRYPLNRRVDGLQNRPGVFGETENCFVVQTVKGAFNLWRQQCDKLMVIAKQAY
jgi:hypothetical protein